MLHIFVRKSLYDESFNFESEGEDEAMFLEYSKIQLVFDAIAALHNDFVLDAVPQTSLECVCE